MSKRWIQLICAVVLVASLSLGPSHILAQGEDLPTILMGEFFFSVPGGSQAAFPPPDAPPQNILTISGAADGEIAFIVENIGAILHEIRSPLFMATKEVKAAIFDAAGNLVAESEGTDLLELELGAGFKAEVQITLAGAVAKSLAADPNLTMTFELSCHVEGHYPAGMRALITVAP
ncbi:MAG: hypothetical protein HY335_01485 [Deinococcus sp.]|nr:hypothetical protein [Deinococcus sp.]